MRSRWYVGILIIAWSIQFSPAGIAAADDPDWRRTASAQSQELAAYIEGPWYVTGSYDDPEKPEPVSFRVYLLSGGTFVDRDNYRGRWLISGEAFTMFYSDESQLAYVGVAEEGEIIGRFRGRDTSGEFRMSR
jgi:hypothetical protein